MGDHIAGLRGFGRLLWALRAIRLYEDGSATGVLWNWWHPLTWIIVPLLVVFSVLAQGVPETIRYSHEIGLGMSPYFIEHPERLKWIKRNG